MTKPREWISEDTETKERHFHGILWTHATMCKGIASRQNTAPYLYVDLHAGRGSLERAGRKFDGSPLIARDILTRTGMPYQAMHYEVDPGQATLLAESLWVPTNLLDTANSENHPIYVERCEVGFTRWLENNTRQHNRYGIVYSDPVHDEIPHQLLNKAAHALPKVDLLAYVLANQYKRRLGQDRWRNGEAATRPRVAEHIAAVRKRFILIREPIGKWQATFILWTDWEGYPAWEKIGFVRLDSERGQRFLERINYTDPEQHERANSPLWGGDEPSYTRPQPCDEPYRSYAEYLKHPRFLEVRAQVFARAAGRCELCGLRPPTEPHHLRYPPWGAFDVPENLIAICHQCHCEIHGKAA